MNIMTRPMVSGRWSSSQLDLIRNTTCRTLTARMFDQFISSAAALNLDPLKRQITPIVFGKRELDATTNKWVTVPQLTLITTIDGYRAIADRTGNYRPDTEVPRFTYDADAKDPDTNPLGLVACEVAVYKFAHGDWHRHPAIIYWDEYVPLKWIGGGSNDDDTPPWPGEEKASSKKQVIDPKTRWAKGGGRGQFAKCCEALAIRRAFPEDMGNLYVEEEMDAAQTIEGELLNATPSERAEQAAANRRLEAAGGKDALTIDWLNGASTFDLVPVGSLADRCMAFLRENADQPATLALFRERNRHALRTFWAKAPGDANEVKKRFEQAIEEARQKVQRAEPAKDDTKDLGEGEGDEDILAEIENLAGIR